MKSDVFDRVLVARLSPQNGCFGPPGDRMVPGNEADEAGVLRLHAGDHFFVSLTERRANAYGYVARLDDPLSPEALQDLDRESLRKLLGHNAEFTVPPIDWYVNYLKSVASAGPGAVMACHWREVRGPGKRRRELSTHKVVLYGGRQQ